MKKLTAGFIKEFIANNDIPFVATQSKLCIPIISRMCQKMSHGIRFDEIKICDNLVIDGHHRYLSSLIMKFELGHVLSNSTSATMAVSWKQIEFEEDDWDTPAKIDYLNQLDAKYNNLEIEFIKEITSSN
jgi:hypothetical protein